MRISNIEYLNITLLQHRVTEGGAADTQQQQHLTQDHGSPPHERHGMRSFLKNDVNSTSDKLHNVHREDNLTVKNNHLFIYIMYHGIVLMLFFARRGLL